MKLTYLESLSFSRRIDSSAFPEVTFEVTTKVSPRGPAVPATAVLLVTDVLSFEHLLGAVKK